MLAIVFNIWQRSSTGIGRALLSLACISYMVRTLRFSHPITVIQGLYFRILVLLFCRRPPHGFSQQIRVLTFLRCSIYRRAYLAKEERGYWRWEDDVVLKYQDSQEGNRSLLKNPFNQY